MPDATTPSTDFEASSASSRRARVALMALVGVLLAAPLAGGFGARSDPPAARPPGAPAAAGDAKGGFRTITEEDLELDLVQLASAPLEGRDSPSAGLDRAADWIIGRLEQAGLTGAGPEGAFRMPFQRQLEAPVPEGCRLSATSAQDAAHSYRYGEDFVPAPNAGGDAEGPLTFVGFGISSTREKYKDMAGFSLRDRIALIYEGEPRHRKKFDGPEVTADADLYGKLNALETRGAIGVLVVRRAPELSGIGKLEIELPPPATLGYRYSWARWAVDSPRQPVPVAIPVLEITEAVAAALVGEDTSARIAEMDRRAKPDSFEVEGVRVAMASEVRKQDVAIHNIVGVLKGSDPLLADEYVVVGAHYDHVGVDVRGRIGFGADDNASGTSALLEVIEALAASQPRRSILACAFASEEDGLLGSKALCDALPVPVESVVAMLNMDMVGRGDADEVAVLGTRQNQGFESLLKQANKLNRTKIRTIVTGEGEELWQRSDHYSFHSIGVPVMFFFEGLPITRNKDYHTWRDSVDLVDIDKVARTARLVFNTAWLLADADERPPRPKR